MVAIDRMNHESHPDHKLMLECEGTPYKCDGCKELGFNWRYTCEKKSACSFDLHRECADPRPSLSHSFFENCSFKFEQGRPRRVCNACGMPVMGFIYHCECGMDLHPWCANLKRAFHDGELELVLHKKMSSKCHACGMKKVEVEGVSTWGYVVSIGKKSYSLHIPCLNELMLESWMTGKSFGDGAEVSRKGEAVGESDGRALVKRTPMLQLVVGENKGTASSKKFAKIKKMLRVAIPFIIAAIFGDPTAMVVGLIANMIAR